jgi:hypothetical protein
MRRRRNNLYLRLRRLHHHRHPPVFSPSTPYTLPSVRETPVSPGLPSKLPNSSFCSVFHFGPCFPHYLPPIGQDLCVTIVSTDDDSANTPDAGVGKKGDNADKTALEKPLDTITAMYAALRACWTPPPKVPPSLPDDVANRPLANVRLGI